MFLGLKSTRCTCTRKDVTLFSNIWSSDVLPTAVRQFLLFSSQLAVRGIPFNLSTQEDIILPVTGSPSYFVGVDFSAEDDAIFFSDTAKDIIYKQKVDGTGEHLACYSC